MKEKEFTLNNATLVWWFVFWRVFLIAFALEVIVQIFGGAIAGSVLLSSLAGWGTVLVSIFATIFFMQMAVNRDYKSKANGSFRLAALELEEAASTSGFAPHSVGSLPADTPPARPE